MNENKIEEFVTVTHASAEDAAAFLARAHGDLPLAVSMYLAESAPPSSASSAAPSRAASRMPSRGTSASSSQLSMHQAPRRRFATFADLANPDPASPGQPPTDPNLFTGGEKSGLAVTPQHHPTNLVDEIIRRAQQNVARPNRSFDGDDDDDDDDDEDDDEFAGRRARAAKPPSFVGAGARLGTDTGPAPPASAQAPPFGPDPLAPAAFAADGDEDGEVQQRTLNFWNDGFSVDDGPLFRFDDPANEAYLRAINTGRAPMRLLNVRPRQPVDVKVVQRHSDYIKPAPTLQNSGPGQRLGSPSPSDAAHAAGRAAPWPEPAPRVPAATPAGPRLGQHGDAAVQLRLADGTLRRARFDRAAPVQLLYDYVDQENPVSRAYVLQLPIPPTPLEDKQQTLESAGAVGAVVVQRWV